MIDDREQEVGFRELGRVSSLRAKVGWEQGGECEVTVIEMLCVCVPVPQDEPND